MHVLACCLTKKERKEAFKNRKIRVKSKVMCIKKEIKLDFT